MMMMVSNVSRKDLCATYQKKRCTHGLFAFTCLFICSHERLEPRTLANLTTLSVRTKNKLKMPKILKNIKKLHQFLTAFKTFLDWYVQSVEVCLGMFNVWKPVYRDVQCVEACLGMSNV